MKIARYVGNLLYDYECVVIPGLGGFLTNDKPVSINEVTHNFSPSFREIHFNIHLRTNDGLLINHVAQQEQIGYKTAKLRVDQFVFQCHNALNSGKKINFKNIGSIFLDTEQNIVFQQNTKVNYNPDSFGLGNLVSPAIRRVSDEEKVKNIVKSSVKKNKSSKKPTDRKFTPTKEVKKSSGRKMQANRRTSTFSRNIIFLLIVAFIMGSGYIYMRRHSMLYYFNQYSSQIPFFYSSVNDYLSTNINTTSVAKLSRSTASFFPIILEKENKEEISNKEENNSVTIDHQNQQTEEPSIEKDNIIVEETPIEVIEEVMTPVNKTTYTKINKVSPSHTYSTKKYFIIAGSFSKESNAIRLVNKLKKQGFEALIADTNKYGMYRVAFSTFNNRADAENKLLAIRDGSGSDAWLLVK